MPRMRRDRFDLLVLLITCLVVHSRVVREQQRGSLRERATMSAQQVAPTRMALQTYKGKLLGAKKGYELLKKKSDALKV